MIREWCGDSPSRLLAADRECVIANYRLIGLRNVRMFVHGANCEGLPAPPRSNEESDERGIAPYSFRICNDRANYIFK